MNENGFAALRAGQPVPRAEVPQRPFADFRRAVVDAAGDGHRVAALFGDASDPNGPVDLYAVLADGTPALLRGARTTLDTDRSPSLTPDCPQAHLFEREIAEQYAACPDGHPWFKPVRYHASYRPGHDAWG